MKFTCTQEHLTRGLGHVAAVAGRNSQLPILEHIQIVLNDGVMQLTATDLQIGVSSTVLGKVEEEGECTILARKIVGYVQQLPKTQPIVLDKKGNVLTVSTKGFHAEFPVGDAQEFPALPQLPTASTITINASVLCSALTRTLFAAARDDTRPEIHSVFVQCAPEQLVLAATDSFRLAQELVTLKSINDNTSLLLPLTTAQEVVRLFTDEDEVVISLHDSHVTFVAEGVELSSRLVDGVYPDYKQIIPTEFSVTGSVDKGELSRALKTLLVFLSRDSRRVYVAVQPKDGVVVLTTGSGESGEGRVSVEFDGEGEDLKVLFNIQYILDCLAYIATERVRLQFVGVSEPAVITPDIKDSPYIYVVMPIQA